MMKTMAIPEEPPAEEPPGFKTMAIPEEPPAEEPGFKTMAIPEEPPAEEPPAARDLGRPFGAR